MALDERRILHIKERLLERGPASVVPEPFSRTRPERAAAYDRVQPFAEAMFLVMSADSVISDSERDVLRGALRTLSEGELGTAATDAMLHELESRLARDGVAVRLDNVAAHLWSDPTDRELALALVIATAAADRSIARAELAAIYELAARLGIKEERVRELVADDPGPPPSR